MAAQSHTLVAACCIAASSIGPLRADCDPQEMTARVTRLIERLGDGDYFRREAATEELTQLGEPALDLLQRAAKSTADPEIRWRAEWIIEEVLQRIELARFQGSWAAPDGVWMKISGDRWSSGTPTFGPIGGRVWFRKREETWTLLEFDVGHGPNTGQTCQVILHVEGDVLHYCGTYDSTPPTEFKTVGNWCSYVFSRAKILPGSDSHKDEVIP